MRFWKGILVTVAVLALASTASAASSAIGVYFDDQASSRVGYFEGGDTQYHTAYVFATDVEMMVGGMAFKLDMDENITVLATDYPDAISLGNPKDGVSIGFETCQPGWFGTPVLACTMTLWTGTVLLTDAEIRVVAHPFEGGVLVSECDGTLHAVLGMTSLLTITVDNEPTSWGTVKDLYK